MAKVSIEFPKGLPKEVAKGVRKVINSNELKTQVGVFSTERLRFQARIRKPLNDTNSFPELADTTILQRAYLQKFNVPHPTYGTSRSNLTFTGQFLNSLGFERRNRGIEFVWKGVRKPYRTGPNSRSRKALTNEDLASFLSELGFVPFTTKGINKDRKFLSQIRALVRRFLRRNLRRS